ncbi:Tryptophan synthase beta chain [Candidatus Vidania fulgoroideae]|nr:Tryptophan synthase beta chain [Candidatus Vidania fulgoroideae]
MNYNFPDKNGFFGKFGGMYVPEFISRELIRIYKKYLFYKKDGFMNFFYKELCKISNKPSLIYKANNLGKAFNNSTIFLNREDLNPTGSHKINNVLGQLLLAREIGYKNIVAETGAGQHGVAVSYLGNKLKLNIHIFIGEKDSIKQSTNLKKIKMMGSKVFIVKKGNGILKDAIDEAIKFWIKNLDNTFYLIGSVVGPHPYPLIVRNFQRIIGKDCIKRIKKIDYLVGCIGGGSNSIGLFYDFIKKKKKVKFFASEACGRNKKNSVFLHPKIGIIHGCKTLVLKKRGFVDKKTISSGLNYPAVGPEHSYLFSKKIVNYIPIKNSQAISAFKEIILKEGIIPSYESSHAIALAKKISKKKKRILINLSGSGEKEIIFA